MGLPNDAEAMSVPRPIGHRYADLAKLPEGDPLLSKPLHSIGAEYKNIKSFRGWIPATEEKLGDYSYNDLTGQWVTFNEWRVPVIEGTK